MKINCFIIWFKFWTKSSNGYDKAIKNLEANPEFKIIAEARSRSAHTALQDSGMARHFDTALFTA